MVTLDPIRLSLLKQRCKILHKTLQNPHFQVSDVVIRNIAFFADLSRQSQTSAFLRNDLVQLKKVYDLVGRYYGFGGWPQLKNHVIEQDCFYRKSAPVFVFKWFKKYPLAYAYHQKHGGYLLRFWGDFIICGQEYINALNLQHLHTAWGEVRYNGVVPANDQAWTKIKKEAVRNYLLANE